MLFPLNSSCKTFCSMSQQSSTMVKTLFYSERWGLKCFRLRAKHHSCCQFMMQAPTWSVTPTLTLAPFLSTAHQRMLLLPLQPPQPSHLKADPVTAEKLGLVVLEPSSVFWHLPLYPSCYKLMTSCSVTNFFPYLSVGLKCLMVLWEKAEREENPKPQVAQWEKKYNSIYTYLLLTKVSCHFTVQVLIYMPHLQAVLYFTLVQKVLNFMARAARELLSVFLFFLSELTGGIHKVPWGERQRPPFLRHHWKLLQGKQWFRILLLKLYLMLLLPFATPAKVSPSCESQFLQSVEGERKDFDMDPKRTSSFHII